MMKHDYQGNSWSLLSAMTNSDIPACLGRNASWPLLMLMLASGFTPKVARAEMTPTLGEPKLMEVVVNSPMDGPIQADEGLTLREAIALINGTLLPDALSAAETSQVKVLTEGRSRIGFNFPTGQTTIQLLEVLPPLMQAGLTVDGTRQPGYVKQSDEQNKIPGQPMVAISPASGRSVLRGLTVMANQVTIRGLQLFGFAQTHRNTAAALPADILITDQDPAQRQVTNHQAPIQGVVIEENWLGTTMSNSPTSAFGVSVFNGTQTRIQNNWIANHEGSAIITGEQATETIIQNNQIEQNGKAGIPDAIRLEGKIEGTVVDANQIERNGGSGIYLFKLEGAAIIRNNTVTDNGQRFKRAAIYLMGNRHQVKDNTIQNQPGPGIVVAAYPKSDRNAMTGNRFMVLAGLSIDLITRNHVGVVDSQMGDGANPDRRDTGNRRLDTANRAINTPRFLSNVFYLQGNIVNLDGKADPGSTVVIYKVLEPDQDYGPLNQPIATVEADEKGRFSLTLEGMKGGDRVSAIATHPNYGTSEPALNTDMRSSTSLGVLPNRSGNP